MKRYGKGPAKVHMQCTSTPCRKRFKGQPGDKCPVCGKNAKPNTHTNGKPWRKLMCDCSGGVWVPNAGDNFTRHRRGSPGCIHQAGLVELELPGTGGEFPF